MGTTGCWVVDVDLLLSNIEEIEEVLVNSLEGEKAKTARVVIAAVRGAIDRAGKNVWVEYREEDPTDA